MKKTKAFIWFLLSLIICLLFTSCSDDTSGSMSDVSKAEQSTDASVSEPTSSDTSVSNDSSNSSDDSSINENVDFSLSVSAVPSETDKGVINAVITLSALNSELSGIQFSLAFSSDTVQGVYTTNNEMANSMTVVPMYDTTMGVAAPRFEQICFYNTADNSYDCMYVDLLSYPSAAEGQTFTGIKDKSEFVITIPFKINDSAVSGNNVTFSFVDGSVKGTKTENFVGAVGSGNSVTYTITDNDVSK